MNPLMVSMGAGMQQNLPANALGGQGATNIFGDVTIVSSQSYPRMDHASFMSSLMLKQAMVFQEIAASNMLEMSKKLAEARNNELLESKTDMRVKDYSHLISGKSEAVSDVEYEIHDCGDEDENHALELVSSDNTKTSGIFNSDVPTSDRVVKDFDCDLSGSKTKKSGIVPNYINCAKYFDLDGKVLKEVKFNEFIGKGGVEEPLVIFVNESDNHVSIIDKRVKDYSHSIFKEKDYILPNTEYVVFKKLSDGHCDIVGFTYTKDYDKNFIKNFEDNKILLGFYDWISDNRNAIKSILGNNGKIYVEGYYNSVDDKVFKDLSINRAELTRIELEV